jgi:L-iditol 2-dehydrogenase
MKAYVLYGVNDLRYDEIKKPECPKGWAIVKVKAAGICSSDIPRIFTKGTYHFPTIPGHEFSGVVDSVGSSVDAHLIGEHVGIFPLIPCRQCEQCKQKHYEMCKHYDYIGSRRDGGLAEFVAVPIWNLIVLNKKIPFTSAAMLEPMAVALHAMKIANVKDNYSVAICGTGMIGVCAGQWAKKLGAKSVVVIGRNNLKRELVENCGLQYITHDALDTSIQYNCVLEAVGTPESITQSINITKSSGTLVVMGNPSGDINLSQSVYWQILRKQLIVKGTWNSSYDGINKSDWTDVVSALADNEINIRPLISHLFNQCDMNKGLELMLKHAEPYCKVMTLWNND